MNWDRIGDGWKQVTRNETEALRPRFRALQERLENEKTQGVEKAASVSPGERTAVGTAHLMLNILRWDWLDGRFTPEERRALPILFLAIFLADKQGGTISRRQASDLMGVDPTRTGPRYVAAAEEHGLLEAVRPENDKRRVVLRPTAKLNELVEENLAALLAAFVGEDLPVMQPSVDGIPIDRRVKEQWGKLTDDDLPHIGNREQLERKIQAKYGYAKDQVKKEVDDWVKRM